MVTPVRNYHTYVSEKMLKFLISFESSYSSRKSDSDSRQFIDGDKARVSNDYPGIAKYISSYKWFLCSATSYSGCISDRNSRQFIVIKAVIVLDWLARYFANIIDCIAEWQGN